MVDKHIDVDRYKIKQNEIKQVEKLTNRSIYLLFVI